MKIKLLDYAGTVHEVEIDDTTNRVEGKIISGDTVLEYPFYYDTGKGKRIIDFLDGSFQIPASKFSEMNKITNSYQLFEYEDVDMQNNGNVLTLHQSLPRQVDMYDGSFWASDIETQSFLNKNLFPEVTFENSPMEVELKLIKKNEKESNSRYSHAEEFDKMSRNGKGDRRQHKIKTEYPNEMIEGLVEEIPNSKYKIGDFVGVSDYESDVRICNIKWNGSEYVYQVFLADEEEWICEDDIVVTEEETTIVYPQNVSLEKETEWNLPDSYEFKDENGNVINATKIVLEKKKPKYPNTYEECCYILGVDDNYGIELDYDDENALFCAFYELKRCRDAYWKIAGEKMGLEKPWEPEYKTLLDNTYFTIHTFNGEIVKRGTSHRNAILAFPTEEMRDAFYEAFKELIEEVKELL